MHECHAEAGGFSDFKPANRFAHAMNRKLNPLPQKYLVALSAHLKRHPRSSLRQARRLGAQAVALGLETLDMALLHEEALVALKGSCRKNGLVEHASLFFAEAIIPIEKTHQAALQGSVRLRQLNKILGQRTSDLAAANRFLKHGINQRKRVEQALKVSGAQSEKLLKESRRLQKHLRHLAHQILAAQENKRTQISRDLHDEIAQNLLGINVRLLTLKQEATVNAEGLQKEIASTRSLVDKSVRSLKQFARKFGKPYESKIE